MKSKFSALLVVLVLLAGLTLQAQTTTVSGNLKTVLSGNLGTNTYIVLRLRNFGSNVPKVTGTGIIVQAEKRVDPDANGLISTTVYDNSSVTPSGTYYVIEFFYQGRLSHAASYTISGASFNFNSATPITTTPTAPVGPDYVIKNPTGDQTVVQPASTAFEVNRLQADVIYQTVTYSATPTFDAASASIFAMTLTGNVTSSTVSNATTGRIIEFVLCQDATAGRTFTWPATFLRPPTLVDTVSACMNASFFYDGTSWRPLGGVGDNSDAANMYRITAPVTSTVTITSSGVANPGLITTAAPHGLSSGQQIRIVGHTGSTPDINTWWEATVTGASTFTIPVNVTVGGTGGTFKVWSSTEPGYELSLPGAGGPDPRWRLLVTQGGTFAITYKGGAADQYHIEMNRSPGFGMGFALPAHGNDTSGAGFSFNENVNPTTYTRSFFLRTRAPAAGGTCSATFLEFGSSAGDTCIGRKALNKLTVQPTAAAFVPNATGQDLGSTTELWDAFMRTVTVGNWNSVLIIDGNKYAYTQTGVNSAIADCPSTGCLIYIPAGTLNVTAAFTTITKPIFFKGAGQGATILKQPNSTNASVNLFAFFAGANNSGIEDLTIDGNSQNNTGSFGGVQVTANNGTAMPTDFVLNRVTIKNCGGRAGSIGLNGAASSVLKNARITNSTFDTNTSAQFRIGWVDGLWITNNRFTGGTSQPSLEVTTENTACASCTTVDNVHINHNLFEGVYSSAQNVVKVQSNDASDVVTSVEITDNVFRTSGTGDVITTSAGAGASLVRVLIDGNSIAASSDLGIAVNGAAGAVITNNLIQNCTNSAIAVGAGIIRYVIANNTILNDQAVGQDGILASSTGSGNDFGTVFNNVIRAGSSGDALRLLAPVTAGSVKAYGNVIAQGAITLGVGVLEHSTSENCSSSASPAVCADNSAGSVGIAAAATTVVVNTTQVTASSQIIVQRDNSLGTKLSVTCNTQSSLILGTPYITARTAGTSFTIGVDVAPTTNPLCISYLIVN